MRINNPLLPDHFYPFLELVAVSEGRILDGDLIVIYGTDGIIQHRGDLLGIIHAEADQGEDSELCREPSGRRNDPCILL